MSGDAQPTPEFIDNARWLAGYRAFTRGDPCPWDGSARAGWIAARRHEQEAT